MYKLTVGGTLEYEGPLMGLLKKLVELSDGFNDKLSGRAVEVWRRARVRRAYTHADKWVLEDGGVWK